MLFPGGVAVLAVLALSGIAGAATCNRTITANVVAIDQPIMFNRLGAQNINGMVFALRRDVINKTTSVPCSATGANCTAGNVQLRPDKRPRPLVLRVAEGDCLTVSFQNLLAAAANPTQQPFGLPPVNPLLFINEQVADRAASFHVQGMQLLADGGIGNDGSNVGNNASSIAVTPGDSKTYKLYAENRGTYLIQSYGATFGSDGLQGNSANGLFGAINVEPSSKTAGHFTKFYRSQLTEEEMRLAADGNNNGIIDPFDPTPGATNERTPAGQPILNYEKKYPGVQTAPCATGDVWCLEGKAGLPIINMLTAANELVHSDINAIIAGPNADGSFDGSTYPLEGASPPKRNPALPNRLEAFREYTVIFHDEAPAAQVFPAWYNHPVFGYVLQGVGDAFMINYGSGGIGSEIIANRLGVGPMHDCLTCSYEEFFLTSYAVGDPAMVVDVPANFGLEGLAPGATPPAGTTGPKATEAYYPDDPSNVHHSYIGDRTVFRNLHVGKEQHIFHLHNHQWLFDPNDPNSHYLDAQGIGPGSGYTYEINYGGSGNRNKSAGDAIFHCHFYPHFAQGMWELWRNHDVYETGTILAKTPIVDANTGALGFHTGQFDLMHGEPVKIPAPLRTLLGAPANARARALPDGEIAAGTPIPAVVPLPGKPMPVMPGRVYVVEKKEGTTVLGSKASVDRTDTYAAGPGVAAQLVTTPPTIKNPGYPFWIASIEDVVGQRPATPPLDMLDTEGGFDGGLRRHALDGIRAANHTAINPAFISTVSARDFSKVVKRAKGVFYPEQGTDVEKAVMDFHGLVRNHPSFAVKLDGSVVGTGLPGGLANFVTNGYRDYTNGNGTLDSPLPVQPGSPFHEPCIDDGGRRMLKGIIGNFFGAVGLSVTGKSPFNATTPRIYKGANVQFDAILNKVGYHYPQQRIIALWDDVVPTITKVKPPEPLVMRLNTFDCAMYRHTNLVPEIFEMDDYQVRTPTDIIGQHIHLPKWDLTTTDGSANGWNYEDGTLAPGAVRERIEAINHGSKAQGTGAQPSDVPTGLLEPGTHPVFGPEGPGGVNWRGARVTLQRWFADPVVNTDGVDRGLGIIFTHDHYGPSTHQQIGLYATVLAEPAGSQWYHNETGVELGTNVGRASQDGGPTSWQAAILPPTTAPEGTNVQSQTLEPFREFYLEYSDFQHAYEKGVYVGAGPLGQPSPTAYPATANTFRSAINPPARAQIAPVFPDLYQEVPGGVLPGCPTRPCPQAISVQDPGVHVVNYRNEPVGLRVYDPNKLGPDKKRGAQAGGLNTLGQNIDPVAGDLGFALSTKLIDKAGNITPINRAIPEMNRKDCNDPQNPDCLNFFTTPLNQPAAVDKNDPFTPMLRAHTGDLVRVKIQSGGHEEEHNATIHGLKWLQGGSGHGRAPNSGWRNVQSAGISEQFTFRTPALVTPGEVSTRPLKDYAYSADGSGDGWWSGVWGILRAYDTLQTNLKVLPGTPDPPARSISNRQSFAGVCPKVGTRPNDPPANLRTYNVVAVLANDVLPNSGVTIPTFTATGQHAGGPLNPAGGTLVYNPRLSAVNGHTGPIHDPTAILYVRAEDLEPVNPALPACRDSGGGPGVTNPPCPVRFKPFLKVEPLVLRASAGECVEVTLFSRLPEVMPDLPTFSMLQGVVKRDRGVLPTQGSTTFNNNLIRPSSQAGLHAQLVALDVTQDDGTNVGQNIVQTVGPVIGDVRPQKVTYRWYAGNLAFVSAGGNRVNLVATPVEFGGSGLIPADKIKQGMKSMVGGLVVLPKDLGLGNSVTGWSEDKGNGIPGTGHQAATFTHPATSKPVRDLMLVMTKHNDQRYRDGAPVEHLNGEGVGIPEDSQESTGMALNYAVEPLWFRLGVAPNASFGNPGFGGVALARNAYSNTLTGGADPATPVLEVTKGSEIRMHVAAPYSTSRGSTFQIHGHVWQRDPYVCPGESKDGLTGACNMTQTTLFGQVPIGSLALGNNPIGFSLGGQESIHSYNHFTFLFPSAGGVDQVTGDYLFRDQAAFGNVSGLWGILRVKP